MASYTFKAADSDQNGFTALFENAGFYVGNTKAPFYTDTTTSGVKLNFGYGYNLTDNASTFPVELKNAGVPATAILRAQEFVNNTTDTALGAVPSVANINAALDATTDYRPVATRVETDFYAINNSKLITYLKTNDAFDLGALTKLGPEGQEGAKLVAEDFAYQGGISTNAIGTGFEGDLQTGMLGAAAWEVAYDTVNAANTLEAGRELRCLGNSVRLFGLTETLGDNLHVQSISGIPDNPKDIQAFLLKHTDNYTHDNPLVTWSSLNNGGTDFQKAMDTYTVSQGYFVAYGDNANPDTTTISFATDTLQVLDSQFYGGVISGFSTGKTLDLTGIGTATKATLAAGNILAVTKSDGTILNIKLAAPTADYYTGKTFNVASDANGGTNITVQGGLGNLGFVFDTTASMGPYIAAVQAGATAILNAEFTKHPTAGVAVVSFKDPQDGDPDQVLQTFTSDQTALQNAIKGLSASGGGDIPEGDYSGLMLALNGSAGTWDTSPSATRQIILYTDAPVKDTDLAAQVNQYAHDLNTVVTTKTVSIAAAGATAVNPTAAPEQISTFTFATTAAGTTPAPVQIDTIQVGSDPTATASVQKIATDNGGVFLQAPTADQLTNAILNDINNPGTTTPTNTTITGTGPHAIATLSGPEAHFTIKYVGKGTATVTDSAGDVVTSINNEVLRFSDQPYFIESGDGANIARLYSAGLGRIPDAGGLFGWEDIYSKNISAAAKAQGVYVSLAETSGGFNGPLSIADGIIDSPEFNAKYGALSNSNFVTQLYQNVLGRAPDATGLNTWLTWMSTGDATGTVFNRGMVLVGFAESPENIAKASSWMTDMSKSG